MKKKNFREICIAIRNRLRRFLFIVTKPFIDLFPVSNKIICFESEPDFSDNAYAFYHFAKQKKGGCLDKYKIVWFLHDFPRNKRKGVVCVNGNNVKNVRSYYYLRRCKYFLYDHNNLMNLVKKREGQIVFGFTHGAGFKGVNKWNNRTVTTVSTLSPFWYPFNSDFEGCQIDKMVDLGYPRNDWFFAEENSKQIDFAKKHNFDKYNKVIVWMPTFRKSSNKTISEEYFESETGLPILKDEQQLEKFDLFLREKRMLCVFKVHHLQAELESYKKTYTNIMILKDEEILESGLQLYQVIALTDALITDYSSISVDYLLMDKPIIYTLDDYEEYKNSRGFYFDNPKELFAGEHVYTENELFNALESVSLEKDEYGDKRKTLKNRLFSYCDGNATERINNFLRGQ